MSRKLKNKLICLTIATVAFVVPALLAGVNPVVATEPIAVVYYFAK